MTDNEKQFEDFIRQIKFDDTPDPNHRDQLEQDLLGALTKQPRRKETPLIIWRMIMKSSITKLATAAAIILIAVFSATFLEKSVTPAWAIEQTIEALENVPTVHMFCRDWDGEEMEIWMKLDPKSGLPEYLYLDYPRHNAVILSTPNISFQHLKKINIVQITNKQLINFDVRLEKIFEEIAKEMPTLEEGEHIKVYTESDPETDKEVIVVWAESKTNEWKIVIEPETKLPISMHCLRSEQTGQVIKDIDEIYFDEDLPEGIFDFTIPNDALVVNQDELNEFENDPNYGISTEGLSQQEAASMIAEEYCRAIIDFDLERVRKIYPGAGLRKGEKVRALFDRVFENNKPVELIEVGQLYWQRGCAIGPVIPCIVKFEDGAIKELKIIIKFRQIYDKESCVIAGMYGLPCDIE